MEHKMEQAYLAMDISRLYSIPEGASRIYVGWEFCHHFILTEDEIDLALQRASNKQQKITFILPYIFQNELGRAKKMVSYLGSLNQQFEIVFNDWGIFRLIEKEGNLQPVMGRLLAKQKLGLSPSVFPALNLSQNDLNYLKKSAVNSLSSFLIEKSIYRAELSFSEFGLDLDDLDERIRVSLYYPLSYISTSRYCRTLCAKKDFSLEQSINAEGCPKYCMSNVIYQSDNVMQSRNVFLHGNTYFSCCGKDEAVQLAQSVKAIDRIVCNANSEVLETICG